MDNYNPSSFVIEFISVSDIPSLIDGKTKINAFLSAYLSSPSTKVDADGRHIPGLEQVGPTVYTSKRYDCSTSSAVFNCYRNFYTQPVHDSILTVELLHYHSSSSSSSSSSTSSSSSSSSSSHNNANISAAHHHHYHPKKSSHMMVSDYMIGKVDIPVRSLVIDELPHTFPMTFKVFSPAIL